MAKILFTNTNCSINKGSAAQVISTCETLRKLIPELEITLVSRMPELDAKLCKIHNINIIENTWIPQLTGRRWRSLYFLLLHMPLNMLFAGLFKSGLNAKHVNCSLINEYLSANAIVDLSGDSFSDDDKYSFSIGIDSSIFLANSLKKPIIIFSQSVGPFKDGIPTFLAKYCLDHSDLVIVREEITKEYLKKLGVKSPVYLTADCAFLLETACRERLERILREEGLKISGKTTIGISANFMLDDKENKYANTLSQLIDYLIEKYDANIIFVPHVISGKTGGRNDDRVIAEKIYNLCEKKERIGLIKGDYSPEELKAVIGFCDIFIGGRMHANIAAISSCIPTMATAWSHKYYGISRAVGLEKYVCDYREININDLKLMVDELWQHKALIQREIRPKVEEQKRLAKYSAELVMDLPIFKE